MYKRKKWGQIFGLIKRKNVIDRPLENKVIKQTLQYNECYSTVLPAVRQCWQTVFPCKYKKSGKVISIFQGLF